MRAAVQYDPKPTGELRIRRAVEEDAMPVWEIRDQPEVRRWSFSSEPVPIDGHLEWFRGRLADPHCRIRVILDGAEVVGYVRVEWGEVSIALRRSHMGRGIGTWAMREVVTEEGTLVARVMPRNVGSIRLFQRAGFTIASENSEVVVLAFQP